MMYVVLVAGLVLLVVGGGLLVRGAVALARRLQISAVIIGMFIVGFGTSAPELTICLDAALAGKSGLALGTVIGSNIANVLLVLGLCALIYPLRVTPRTVCRDGFVMLAGTILFLGFAWNGVIVRAEGAFMVGALLVYAAYAIWVERFRGDPAGEVHIHEAEAFADGPRSLAACLAALVAGLGGVLLGAELVVQGAVGIARELRVPEVAIGLSLVALGTSLPELAIGVIAVARRQGDIIVGNVLGSNLFNLLGIMGTTALATPIGVPESILAFDVWVMTGVVVVFLIFLVTGWRLNRLEGGILFAAYLAYLAVVFLGDPLGLTAMAGETAADGHRGMAPG